MTGFFGRHRTGANARGFTMIEVISVILVIAILTVVFISATTSTAVYTLKSQTDVIKTHLRYAQTRAMNSSVLWGINFAGGSYTLITNGAIPSPVMLPGEDSNVVTLPSGVATTTGIVTFNDWGKPYTDAAGTTPQNGDRDITVSLSGATSEKITITRNTGFIP
ncbi:MAG: type II secretion system protein [Candidatus Latescibacterota bacterium]